MTRPKGYCLDCGARPQVKPRRHCAWCILKREPMHVQAEAAKLRLAMVPEELRLKRSQKVVRDDTPDGLAFCASCQTFCPDWYFGKSATQCKPCASMKSHEAMVKKSYGIDGDEYARILEVQGGKCAICRQGFKSIRGAVDHDHKTNAVRGVLDARCNHEALGALHDEPRAAWNAYLYLTHPPALLRDETWEQFLERHPMPTLDQVVAKDAAPEFALPSGKSSKAEAKAERPRPLTLGEVRAAWDETPTDHGNCWVCVEKHGDKVCAPF